MKKIIDLPRNFSITSDTSKRVLYLLLAALCLLPFVGPPVALIMGILAAQFIGNPYLALTRKLTHYLLQASIIALGFGINLFAALKAGELGFFITFGSIVIVLGAGWWLGRRLGVDSKVNALISSGTAICGGSAIAAISPLLRAKDEQISVALGTVFLLNSVALFAFPPIGHWVGLSQSQFGYWAAIAIHDTSSVVGAAYAYGEEALRIATTVKLQRALWIIPLSAFVAYRQQRSDGSEQRAAVSIPWFILLFVLAMVANTFVPGIGELAPYLTALGKRGMTLTLFLIGSGLTLSAMRKVGWRPLATGIALWVLISVLSLLAIEQLSV